MDVFPWMLEELLVVWGIIGVAALVHGAVGLGLGLVAVPVLLQVDAAFVPGPVLCCTLILTIVMVLRERRSVDFFGLKWSAAGRVIGTAIASYLLVSLPQDLIVILSAILILLAVGLSLTPLDVAMTRGALLSAGTLSGIMSTLASVGGPPIALLYQHERGPRLRATLSGFFILGSIISLVGLAVVGRYGLVELKATMVLLPAVGLGYAVSCRMLSVLDRGYTRLAVLLVSAASSVVLLVRHLA